MDITTTYIIFKRGISESQEHLTTLIPHIKFKYETVIWLFYLFPLFKQLNFML